MNQIVVIGAGAAGIIAAWRAASAGAHVILLEKEQRIGSKILISGGGKCNITHDGNVEEMLHCFRPEEARFLRPSFYQFDNQQICDMLTLKGLKVYTRPDGRIFPDGAAAKEVISLLAEYLRDAHVELKTGQRVSSIEAYDNHIKTVIAYDSEGKRAAYHPDCVIISTGGYSYPGTGATGEGWGWLAGLGHSVSKPRAALAPIFLNPQPPPEWAGISIKECLMKARHPGKEVSRTKGDILFTHRGVSGPAILEISKTVAEARASGDVSLFVDLIPGEKYEIILNRIEDWGVNNPGKHVKVFASDFLPDRLVDSFLQSADACGARGSDLLGKRGHKLAGTFKDWFIGIAQQVPLEKGEVTAGGVSLSEVDPQTMASRLIKGLYICGEILDVAGPVGGYNLQAAFSTGYTAGDSAANNSLEQQTQ
jgi:predicted Rossmann fold flavoprotein